MGDSDSSATQERPTVFSWRAALYDRVVRSCDDLIKKNSSYHDLISAMPLEAFVAQVDKCRNLADDYLTFDPVGLSASEVGEEVEVIAAAAQKLYAPVANGNGAVKKAPELGK